MLTGRTLKLLFSHNSFYIPVASLLADQIHLDILAVYNNVISDTALHVIQNRYGKCLALSLRRQSETAAGTPNACSRSVLAQCMPHLVYAGALCLRVPPRRHKHGRLRRSAEESLAERQTPQREREKARANAAFLRLSQPHAGSTARGASP